MEFDLLKPIGHLFTLPKLKLEEGIVDIWEKEHPFTPLFKVKDKSTFLGIEVETENVLKFYQNLSPFWSIIEDGSLRNQGKEFITIPTRAHRIEQALTFLFDYQLNSDIDFSERTSIHVHLNVRTFTPKQLMSLLLTYITFEKVLFNWVGKRREQNIFCTPLYSIDDIKFLYMTIKNLNHGYRWNKYSALNLAPIVEKGTIEFRHLHGTKEIKRLMFWINLILSLKLYALRTDPELVFKKILDLSTDTQYFKFLEEVFTDQAKELWSYPNFSKDCQYCTNIIKERVFQTSFDNKTQIKDFWEKGSPLSNYWLKTMKQTEPKIKIPRGPDRQINVDEPHIFWEATTFATDRIFNQALNNGQTRGNL